MNETIDLLYKMLLIREFENALSVNKMNRNIYGMVHCYNGQEAVAVGVCSALNKDDYMISNHRPHGHAIAKGADLKSIMAEIFGKKTGSNGGKGGSMHITDRNCGFITATGIVGSGIPVACGAAFSSKYKKDGRVTCIFIGDGSTNEGTFYEGLNLAAKWNLPIIFVVEDNGLAVTTSTDQTSACRDYTKLADAFDILSISMDGQDVESIYNQMTFVVSDVRTKKKPYLIQLKTIRFKEHAEGEYYLNMRESGYRDTKKLDEDIKRMCPIKRYKKKLMHDYIINSSEFDELQERAIREVKDALRYALESAYPQNESAFSFLYWEE